MAVIAVVDALPLFRLGTLDALRNAGYGAVEIEDPVTWVADGCGDAAVVSLRVPSDWSSLETARRADSDLPLIALLSPYTRASCIAAVRRGASSTAPRETSRDDLAFVVHAALKGHAYVHGGALPALGHWRSTNGDCEADDDELLAALARGETVAQIARQRGCSKSTVHRRLQEVYRRLGVATRAEAILRYAHRRAS